MKLVTQKDGTFDWEVVLRVADPKASDSQDSRRGTRPRRMSIHAIASVCGRDPFDILKEMQETGKALGYCCPDVGGAPIFYLKENRHRMIDTARADIWTMAPEILRNQYKFPEVQGFQRFKRPYGIPTPFNSEETEYEVVVRETLKKWREGEGG